VVGVQALRVTPHGTIPVQPEDLDAGLDGGPDAGIVWLHVDHDDKPGMHLLGKLVDVRDADVQDCHARRPVPKLHVYPDHHFSAINGLARGTDGRLYFQPIKTFRTTDLLVTVLGPCNTALSAEAATHELAALRHRLEGGELRPQTSFELIAALRASMMTAQEDLVGELADQIARFESRLLYFDPVRSESLLQDLIGLRHDLQSVRTNAAQTAELYTFIAEQVRSDQSLRGIELGQVDTLKHASTHLMNTADLEREYLQEMIDLFQTRVSTELNRFVRKVTAWGSIGVAWTAIAGIYGMNFDLMPELHWTYGYPYALGLMFGAGVILAVMFRRKGWL
jgi:Mg2+ and Co2+ transporter CorA